jgi:hypothetical protein
MQQGVENEGSRPSVVRTGRGPMISAKRLARLLALRHGPRATEKVEQKAHEYGMIVRRVRSHKAAGRFIFYLTVLHQLQRIHPEPIVS